MKRSPFLHNALLRTKTLLNRSYAYTRALLRNRYAWGGLGILLVLVFTGYLLFNYLIMPAYTRYDVTVRVPDVRNRPFEEARQILTRQGLNVGQPEQRFNANYQPNVVLDQNPHPDASVKPGRLVYVTINTGSIPTVTVPRVEGLSLREARNRLLADGLEIEAEQPDSIPSPYSNTVTRQRPAAGTTVPRGSGITLWYSRGLGDRFVVVPDVTGMGVTEARQTLLRSNLRSVVLDLDESLGDPVILRQSREPGTHVREGFEIRLFTKEE